MDALQPDFSVLMTTDSTSLLDGFGFLQFLQIFLLGDTRVLLSIVPRVSVGLFGQDEDILSDSRTSKSFIGDPIKNTMLLQSIRRFPVITAVPLVVTIVLLVVDIVTLLNPMFHRILGAIPSLAPVMAPFLADFIENEEEASQDEGINDGIDGILEQAPPRIGHQAYPILPFSDGIQQTNSDYYNMRILQAEQFPTAVYGIMQSPVEISSHNAVFNSRLGPVTFKYSRNMSNVGVLSNTGLGWQVKTYHKGENAIHGVPFIPGNYLLDHYTMHWGDSEHAIDGEKQSGELQLYHYRAKYNNWDQAVQHDAGVAVVAVLLKIGDNNPVTELDKLAKYLSEVTTKGEEVLMEEQLDLNNILPKNRDFFTYQGSLTTPGFNENVIWTVMRDPILVSRQTINGMKSLRYGMEMESQRMNNNCRKQVMLGNRKVFTSWKIDY